ncbi:MAG TPA: MFS transporter [Acetobacteraceae bacterium]|jgi:MFS family permease
MSETTAAVPPWQNRWVRILIVALLMYIISMIDRTNIAMAIPSMRAELGLGRAGIGFATGTFFFGYVVLQIPAGRLSSVWSAKWVIFTLLLFWGAISASTALVHTEGELILNRFMLGVAEGGVLTSTLVLIRNWFTREERARANTVFLMSLALGSVIANPISGVVLKVSTWQWMFVIEAIPCFVWAAFWAVAITDRPEHAAWLPDGERRRLTAALAAERALETPILGHWTRAIWNPAVLIIAAYNFLALAANWGVTIWLPSVLKQAGLSIMSVGFLSAIPYAAGAIAMLIVAFSSDRRMERKWHTIVMTGFSGVFLLAAQLSGETAIMMTLLLLTLSFACFYGRFGPFWALPSEVLPASVAGVGIAVINGIGNLGGFAGPFAFGAIRTATGNFGLALSLAGLVLVVSAAVLVMLRMPGRKAALAPAE